MHGQEITFVLQLFYYSKFVVNLLAHMIRQTLGPALLRSLLGQQAQLFRWR